MNFRRMYSKEFTQITNGLHMEQLHKGYWVIKQTNLSKILIGSHDKASVAEAGKELVEIANWNTTLDVIEHFKAKRQDLFESFVSIKNRYHEEYRMNVGYLESLSDEGEVSYEVDDDGSLREVTGFHVSEGLAVHEEPNGNWTVDHVASAMMLTEVSSKKVALDVAGKLEPLLTWKRESVLDIIKESDEVREYMGDVKQAAENGLPLPTAPQVLFLQMVFMQMDDLKGKWEEFRLAWLELDRMVGLANIKDQIVSMVEQVRGSLINQHKVKSKRGSMHMTFEGPPGTGKTEVARIISKIFHIMGFTRTDAFVEVDRLNIIGNHIGDTEQNMKKYIKEAMGGFLFIDEAYALASGKGSNDFGKEAINVLIKAMEDNRDDLIVILAGYENDMASLLEMNEGFTSRIRHRLNFKTYTPNELAEIAVRMITSKGYRVNSDVVAVLESDIRSVAKGGGLPGNARDIRNIVQNILDKTLIRIGRTHPTDTLLVLSEDVKEGMSKKHGQGDVEGLKEIRQEAMEELEQLIGMNDLKNQVRRILKQMEIEKKKFEMGIATQKPRLHMIFAGPSGTGKTTVAKIIGKFLKGTGMLSNGHFRKVTRSDLVGSYQGHTAKAVKEQVRKSLGGIMLIDEAYNLVNGPSDTFGLEAVAELIDLMEEHKDDFVVILAGYEEPIKKLLSYNEGFPSRIAYNFLFPNYTAKDVADIAKLTMNQQHMFMTPEAEALLYSEIERIGESNGGVFDGNGRWASNFVTDVDKARTERFYEGDIEELTREAMTTVLPRDILKATEFMLENA